MAPAWDAPGDQGFLFCFACNNRIKKCAMKISLRERRNSILSFKQNHRIYFKCIAVSFTQNRLQYNQGLCDKFHR